MPLALGVLIPYVYTRFLIDLSAFYMHGASNTLVEVRAYTQERTNQFKISTRSRGAVREGGNV